MVAAEIRRFETSDGYKHHYRHWQAGADRPRCYIVALHGIQSHSGWYEYSSGRLSAAGYDVSFLDRRGSGLNQQSRGDAPHYQRLVNDVVQFLGEVGRRRQSELPHGPRPPVLLMGISWSGKLAALVASERPAGVDALVLLYPGICARVKPSWLQNLQLSLAESLNVREKRVPVPLNDETLFTGQTKWQEFIRNDSLKLEWVTVRFLLANRELDRRVAGTPERIHCPVLLMLAGQDRIIDNPATRRFLEQVASPNKTLIEYPEAQHTLEFEPDRDRFLDDLLRWMEQL